MDEDEGRLYFIIRSWIMGQIGGVILLTIVWILGSINFIQMLVIGFFIFIASLFISRLFDSPITKGTKKILIFLDRHRNLRTFILKHF